MLIDDLIPQIKLSQSDCQLWLCKPDLDKTVIARLWEARNLIKLNLKFGNVSEMTFKIPFRVEKNHIMIDNPHIPLLKDRYLIKLIWGNYTEFFTIRIPSDSMSETEDLKSFTCFSLQYELNDKQLKDFNAVSYNANDALVGNGVDKTGILSNSLWTLDYVDPDFNSMFRTISISSATILEGVFQIATTFGAIVLWNTTTRKISLYKQENIGLDRGLKFSYGHYLKTLQQDINSDDVCTRLKVYGKSNLTIQEYNTTGANYIEDYSYFLYPFQRDASKVVLQSSNYMSDSLCNALLDYQALVKAKEPVTKIAETGTTTTNIKITAHGLIVGDYISNTTRANTVQKVTTVVDVNNVTVASITGQTTGDSIDLYKDGTYGKLLYQLNDQQALLTTRQNELSTLTTDMNVIQDNLSIALSTNATYGAITTYSIGNTVVYNSVPYRCILASTGNLPTNATYWENLVTSKTNKQIAIDAKNAEITTVNSAITSLNSQVTTLRNGIKIESSLTLAQLQELNQFIIEKEVINDYIDDAKQLLLWAKKEFTKINTPPINLKIGVVDLFKTFDKSAQIDRDKIVLAETVTVQNDRLNINTKAKIIEINIDFESYDALTVTIANVQQILTDQQKFIKMLNQAISTSTQVDLGKLKWDLAADKADLVSNILNSAYDATKQSILAGVNNTVELSRKGLLIKDSTDPLSYLVANNSTLAITNDGGNTWKNAITKNGIIGDRIIGQILMSNILKMTNANADFTFDQNGVVLKNTGITITGGLPSAQMDSTVVTNATNGSTAYSGTTTYRDPNAPNGTFVCNAISSTINTDGSSNITLSWAYIPGTIRADGFVVVYETGATSPNIVPTTTSVSYYQDPATTGFTMPGIPANKYHSFKIYDFRHTNTGVVVGALFNHTSWLNYQPSASVSFNGNVTGLVDGKTVNTINIISPSNIGNGSDGVFNSISNITLAVGADDAGPVTKQYTSFTLNAGHTLTVDRRSKGLIVYSQGDVNISGTISMDNLAARFTRDVSTPPWINACAKVSYFDYLSKTFVEFLLPTGGSGGAGGTSMNSLQEYLFGGVGNTVSAYGGGSGGGGSTYNITGGAGDVGAGTGATGGTSYGTAVNGGAGGLGGGGIIVIVAKGNITINSGGIVTASSTGSGGAGGGATGNNTVGGGGGGAGNGGIGASMTAVVSNRAIGGGGGGGGGGGIIVFIYGGIFINNGSIIVNAGAGGIGGVATGSTYNWSGGAGGNGTVGSIYTIKAVTSYV